jgi:hypothetical protein
VNGRNPSGTLNWHGRGRISVNLFDASDEQLERFRELEGDGIEVVDCGIEYRPPRDDDAEGERLQLQIDEDSTVQPIS